MSHDTTNTKTCKRCGVSKYATNEYFCNDKNSKDGLNSWCKICVAEYQKANADRLREYNREYRRANVDKRHKYNREYYQANADKRREQAQEYRQANPEYQREYAKANSDKRRINEQRRRARKQSLPNTFTIEQWEICLEYFGYACAVCGISFDDKPVYADHWIPITSDDCTGTIATNMICLCSDCNLSKHDRMPGVWLKEKYDTSQANEILKRVQTYFEWVEGQLFT